MRKLMFVLVMMMTTAVMADNYSYLTVSSSAGNTSYEVSNISKITFDESNMILWSGNEKLGELPLSTLERMSFSGEGMGISASGLKTKSTIQNGVLRVVAPEGSRVTLYNMKGEVVKEVTATAQETEMNLSGLRKGVYIVKVGDRAQKFMNK